MTTAAEGTGSGSCAKAKPLAVSTEAMPARATTAALVVTPAAVAVVLWSVLEMLRAYYAMVTAGTAAVVRTSQGDITKVSMEWGREEGLHRPWLLSVVPAHSAASLPVLQMVITTAKGHVPVASVVEVVVV